MTDITARAQRRLAGEPDAPAAPADALAIGWALKQIGHAAWNSAPQQAIAAAGAVAALLAEWPDVADGLAHAPDPRRAELAAVAGWTQGLAAIARGEMNEALAALDAAADGFERIGQPHPAAQVRVARIVALSMLGQFDAAADSAEPLQQALLALGDVAGAAKVKLNLGSLHLRREAYADAARQYREAAVLFARVGNHEHSVMADIGLADAQASLGDLDEAGRIYARAAMRASGRGLRVLEALIDESVALLDMARGRYREALAGFERSRRGYEQLGMRQPLAIAEKQLADAYLELRLLPEALALLAPALDTFAALDMPYEQAWALLQRGLALQRLGRAGPAREALDQASAAFARLPSALGEAAVGLAQAELLLAGGQALQAQALAATAAAAFAQAGRPDLQLRAELLRGHALLAPGGGGVAGIGAAEDAARQAAQCFSAVLQRSRELQWLPLQVRAIGAGGLAAQALGDDAAAEEAFEQAIEMSEDQRRALPDDSLRGAFLSDHLMPYQQATALALSRHAEAPGEATATRVLQCLDRYRARVLSDRVERPALVLDDAPTQALRARLNWLVRRTLRLDDDAAPPSPAQQQALHEAEHALLEIARRERLLQPAAAGAASAAQALDVAALQQRLADGALVAYGMLAGELFACVVTAGALSVHRRLASWAEVMQAWDAARFQIDTLRHGSAALQRHLPLLAERLHGHLQRLHRLVWQPLQAVLAGVPRVLVVPHGPLGALPFAALPAADGQPLGLRHVLALAPSARWALHGLRHPPVAARRALALGVSTQLPHAAAEAQAVAASLPQGRACVGEEASLATLQAHAGEADVLHLACHAQFRPDNPLFSALHLADGALTVERAEALRLRPGLVVLSACESGRAADSSGDEAAGLVRAFLGAGAARVLASLWPVEDAVAALFMGRFYAALRAGAAPSAALQAAQHATRAGHPHPCHWAGFVLHGGW